MSRKIKIIFVISILANLLLLGVIGGHKLKHWSHHQEREAHMEKALKDVPAETAEKIKSTLDEMFRKHRQSRKQARQLRKETINLLTAEPFDKPAYQAKVEQMHHLREDMMRNFAREIAALAEGLTAQERKALGEILRHPPHKRYRHRKPPKE